MAAQTLGSQHCVTRYHINSKSGVVREGEGLMVRLRQPTLRQSIAVLIDVLMPKGGGGVLDHGCPKRPCCCEVSQSHAPRAGHGPGRTDSKNWGPSMGAQGSHFEKDSHASYLEDKSEKAKNILIGSLLTFGLAEEEGGGWGPRQTLGNQLCVNRPPYKFGVWMRKKERG